jgi:hypothetical protein
LKTIEIEISENGKELEDQNKNINANYRNMLERSEGIFENRDNAENRIKIQERINNICKN